MTSVLDAALDYAQSGFKVIPTKGKAPWFKRWTELATTDKATIQRWWKDHPQSNVGICPDERFCILDVDHKKGGEESIADLEHKFGSLPETIGSRTGGGGTHQYYRVETGRRLRYIPAPAIEILGPGRQAIEWPSLHPDTGHQYVWHDGVILSAIDDLPMAPDWFYEDGPATGYEPPVRPQTHVNGTAKPISLDDSRYRYCRAALDTQRRELGEEKDGNRNAALNTAALKLGALHHYGAYSQAEAEAALRSGCETNGYIASDGFKAFEATFRSGWDAGIAKPHDIPERPDRPERRRAPQEDPPLPEIEDYGAEPISAEPRFEPQPDMLPVSEIEIPAPETIRPRPWIYGHQLMRGAVTILAAPGGTGKTALTTGIIMACATGRELLDATPHRALTCVFLGLEESEDEMRRRFAAAMIHYGVTSDQFRGRLFTLDGRKFALTLARHDEAGHPIRTPDVDLLKAKLRELSGDLLVVDPLALCHGLTENNNDEMAFLTRIFTEIAQEMDCAILIVHHTRKGAQAGDPDAIRGAGALVNHARIALGLTPMSEDEAAKFNVDAHDRRRTIRLDDLKRNYSPKAGEESWIRLESIRLHNGTNDYPYGDSVQVAATWSTPIQKADPIGSDVMNEILDEIEAGIPAPLGPERYSSAPRADGRAAFQAVLKVCQGRGLSMNEKAARKIIGEILKSDRPLISERPYHSLNERKTVRGLEVNQANRPRRGSTE
jgi:hypothetical protein